LGDQVRTQRLLAGFIRRPFEDERDRHPVLHRREAGRGQLIEYPDKIEATIGTFVGLVAEHRKLELHGAGNMPGLYTQVNQGRIFGIGAELLPGAWKERFIREDLARSAVASGR